jgi:hypothetical protein
MNNSISVDQALAQLKDMFPSFDEEVLSTMLLLNNNHIEHTIEQVLQMEVDSQGGNSNDGSSTSDAPVSNPKPVVSRPWPENGRVPEVRKVAQQQAAGAAGGDSNNRKNDVSKRGTPTTLPNTFLRPPGWRESNNSIATVGDEQLALMLQDELFRKELQAAGGMAALLGSASGSESEADSIVGGDGKLIPDMGILKGLSSLSQSARSNLNGIAQRFASRSSTSGEEAVDDGVSMSLLHSSDPDEEVIDFQRKKGQ